MSHEQALADELAPLSAEARADFVVKRLTLLYHGKFRPLELDALRCTVLKERWQAEPLLREGYARLEGQAYVDELKTALADPAAP